MRAITISIGKFHIVLAAGKAASIQLTAAKPKPAGAPIRQIGNEWVRETSKPKMEDRPKPAPSSTE